jgi:hypothetical protein
MTNKEKQLSLEQKREMIMFETFDKLYYETLSKRLI